MSSIENRLKIYIYTPAKGSAAVWEIVYCSRIKKICEVKIQMYFF